MNLEENPLLKEFPDTNFFQSVNTLYYNHLLIVIDILGRAEALEFYKEDVWPLRDSVKK